MRAFEHLVDKSRGAVSHGVDVGTVAHQQAGLSKLSAPRDSRKLVLNGQLRNLRAIAKEHCVRKDNHHLCLVPDRGERALKVLWTSGVRSSTPKSKGANGQLRFSQFRSCNRILGIGEHSDSGEHRYDFLQQLNPLTAGLRSESRLAGDVTAGS